MIAIASNAWKIRLLLCQIVGVLALGLYHCSLTGREPDASMERFYLSLAAESILFPLGACLIAYVMWGLLLHVFSFSMKPMPLRIVCGVLGSLPVLGFLLGAAAYWNGWRWCLFAANYYFNLEILRGFYQPLPLILLSLDMLLLALSIEPN